MFERYTEKARRVIFFARYEASQFGSPDIESEFLLLAMFREDNHRVTRWLGGDWHTILRQEIEQRVYGGPKTPTSVDLPLSDESKCVLAYAAEESDRLGHKHIGTEHLLLGLLRDRDSRAARLLLDRGVNPDAVGETIVREGTQPPALGARARAVPHYPITVHFALGKGAEGVEFDWPQRIPVIGEFIWLGDDRSVGYQVTRVEWTVDKDSETPHPTKVVIYADEFSMGHQADAI
ncbi:MAG TPA: Clp protease N-terminal domain-containing protein [Alloacidobacterium sp.]|nr:Clp protease N-terminal domain-containing protein [Alloacidobacterium sp.]